MSLIIKNFIRSSTLYFYHLAYPENEFLNELMNKSFDLDENTYWSHDKRTNQEYYSHYLSYLHILKNNQLDIIYEVIPIIHQTDLEILGIVAVEENNKDIIELLYKNGLKYNFFCMNCKYNPPHIVHYAYIKHGLELVKFIVDLNTEFLHEAFDYYAEYDPDLLDYLVENTQPLDRIFIACLNDHSDTLAVLDFFVDKINMITCYDRIINVLYRKSFDIIKILPKYGISLDLPKLLSRACLYREPKLDIVEYCLQNGAEVDQSFLHKIIRECIYVHSNYDDSPFTRSYKNLLILLMEYNVDFSRLQFNKTIDYQFLEDLENHGLDKNAFVNYTLS